MRSCKSLQGKCIGVVRGKFEILHQLISRAGKSVDIWIPSIKTNKSHKTTLHHPTASLLWLEVKMALRCSKLAFHSCLSSIMAEEEDHIVSTCMDLIVESMRELHDLGQRIITLETVRQRMAFEHAFDVIANHKLIQRSMKILMTKGIVKKRGQWYDLAAHPEKVKVGGDGTKKSKVGNVATSTHSIELACKKWIIKSLEELENKTVHFQKLTHHMAFEHGFNIIANESLIKTTLKELRDKGTIKKNGFGYKLAENHQEKVSRKTSKEKMVESLLKYSGASCMALILKSLKELDPKGKGVPLIKFMRHMAFEHSYNILDNDALIKSTLKKLLNDGLVIKKGSRYKLFQEQKDAKPRAKLSKSKLSSIAETKANIDASTLTKNSLKALISNHALRSRSQLGLANNRHLIQRSCKLMSVKTDANPYPKQKDTLRGQHKDRKCDQCSFKTSYVTDLHRHKMMNHGIDRDNTHQTSAYVIASEDKSYLYLHKINKATMKSSSAQKAIPRGVPITPWGVPITPRGVPIIPKNFVVITQSQVKATMRSSPQKAIPAIPKNLVVITSLFGLLPPEMGLEIIKRLDLGDLDALFTAFDDLRATYLPFLRSLSYTDPDPSSEKAFACREGCDTLTRLGFYGVKRIFLGNRLTNR